MCHRPLANSMNFFHQKAVALHVNILTEIVSSARICKPCKELTIPILAESIPVLLKRLQIRVLT
jgi:hypothetical protein